MHLWRVLLALWCVCNSRAQVVSLTGDNFASTVDTTPVLFVQFFAPWCAQCKQMAPEFEQAASQLADKGVVFGQLDASVYTDIADQHDVRGYPTLRLFRNRAGVEYTGDRTAAAMVSFVTKHIGPALRLITASNDLHTLIAQAGQPFVTGFFANQMMPEFKFFEEYADGHRTGHDFVAVVNPSIFHEFNVFQSHAIVVFKPFDDKRVDFEGKLEPAALEAFLREATVRLVGEIGPNNYQMYLDRGRPIVWLFLDYSDPQQQDAYTLRLSSAAKHFLGRLSFVYLNGQQYGNMAQKLGLSGGRLPALAIEDTKSQHYAFDETAELSVGAITKFCTDFEAGLLHPTIRSEPVPANSEDNGVRVVVGETFAQIVEDASKDVLIEFYAPWCGHCKNLAPIYEAFAKAVKHVPTLVVAKIDGTQNDAPSKFAVQGFPTVFLSPAGNGSPVEYTGNRTIKSFVEFVRTHAKFGLPAIDEIDDGSSPIDEDDVDDFVSRSEVDLLQAQLSALTDSLHRQDQRLAAVYQRVEQLEKELAEVKAHAAKPSPSKDEL